MLQELVDLLFMHERNGCHKSMHNYNKILEEISDGLEVEKVFLGKAKSIIATHTMSELALMIKKISKSFDHSYFFSMHWTNLFSKNGIFLASPF